MFIPRTQKRDSNLQHSIDIARQYNLGIQQRQRLEAAERIRVSSRSARSPTTGAEYSLVPATSRQGYIFPESITGYRLVESTRESSASGRVAPNSTTARDERVSISFLCNNINTEEDDRADARRGAGVAAGYQSRRQRSSSSTLTGLGNFRGRVNSPEAIALARRKSRHAVRIGPNNDKSGTKTRVKRELLVDNEIGGDRGSPFSHPEIPPVDPPSIYTGPGMHRGENWNATTDGDVSMTGVSDDRVPSNAARPTDPFELQRHNPRIRGRNVQIAEHGESRKSSSINRADEPMYDDEHSREATSEPEVVQHITAVENRRHRKMGRLSLPARELDQPNVDEEEEHDVAPIMSPEVGMIESDPARTGLDDTVSDNALITRDEQDNDDGSYVVERIADVQLVSDVLLYHVTWENYPESSWLSWTDLLPGSDEVVQEFHAQHPGRPGPPTSEQYDWINRKKLVRDEDVQKLMLRERALEVADKPYAILWNRSSHYRVQESGQAPTATSLTILRQVTVGEVVFVVGDVVWARIFTEGTVVQKDYPFLIRKIVSSPEPGEQALVIGQYYQVLEGSGRLRLENHVDIIPASAISRRLMPEQLAAIKVGEMKNVWAKKGAPKVLTPQRRIDAWESQIKDVLKQFGN